MGYLAQLYLPAQLISETITDMQGGLASAVRVFAVLDEAPDVIERPHARALTRAAGELRFRNVSFAYAADQPPVLRNVSLDVPSGTRLGIKGVTGAGKTTLVNLVSRFYDPTGGQVLLDGVDLRDTGWPTCGGSSSCSRNRCCPHDDRREHRIREAGGELTISCAAKAAHAHEFIAVRRHDTVVGERGMRLSAANVSGFRSRGRSSRTCRF
jgi:ATP-binding cassette subfamily B protein